MRGLGSVWLVHEFRQLSLFVLRLLNKSGKYTGANLSRDLNIITDFCFFRLTKSVSL